MRPKNETPPLNDSWSDLSIENSLSSEATVTGPIVLKHLFAEPLFSEIEFGFPSSFESLLHNGESSSRNDPQPQLRSKPITLEYLFAEPLFSGIKFDLPSSEDYMMIEPLFSNLIVPGEPKNGGNIRKKNRAKLLCLRYCYK